MTIERPKPIFSCDRCGYNEEVPHPTGCSGYNGRVSIPEGAIQMSVSAQVGGRAKTYHLCSDCKASFYAFLEHRDYPKARARNKSEAEALDHQELR